MSLVDKLVKRVIITSLFGDGWGDRETFDKLLQLRRNYKFGLDYFSYNVESNFKLSETKNSPKHVINYTGSFNSPLCRESPDLIPPESHTCRFHMTLPRDWGASERRVCLHYPATGDHTFWRRYRFLAHPLARDYKIGSVIVENPFYGGRKPKKQVGSGIRHVSDLFTMGSALVLEGGFILSWLESEGYEKLGISGVSLGGHNASLTSAVWGKPIATVPCLSWSTAAHTFSEGIISHSCMWSVLMDQLTPAKLEEIREVISKSDHEIQEMLEEYGSTSDKPTTNSSKILNRHLSTLTNSFGSRSSPDRLTSLYLRLLIDEFSNLKNYPPIACPDSAIVVVANSDLYVTRPADDDMIKDITEIWPGCEVRVVNGGHISSYLTHNHTFRKAINDAFNKLDVFLEHN